MFSTDVFAGTVTVTDSPRICGGMVVCSRSAARDWTTEDLISCASVSRLTWPLVRPLATEPLSVAEIGTTCTLAVDVYSCARLLTYTYEPERPTSRPRPTAHHLRRTSLR